MDKITQTIGKYCTKVSKISQKLAKSHRLFNLKKN